MDNKDMLNFYRWITKIGLVLFIAFSYFYYGPMSTLEQNVIDLNQEIEIDNISIEEASSNNTKRTLIKTNLAKANSLAELNKTLMIYRIVAIVFILAGIGSMGYGILKIKNYYFPPKPKETEAEKV